MGFAKEDSEFFLHAPPSYTGVAFAEKNHSLVQDGLKEIDMAVGKIRECVKYVKGSQVRKQKFFQCVEQTSFDSKRALVQDVPTR